MRILLDTNVLLRSAQPKHPQFQLARDSVRNLIQQNHEVFIVPQNLYEFWVVATRPVDRNGLSLSVQQTLAEVNAIRAMFTLLLDERGIYSEWEPLVTSHAITGKRAHDARLVAAALRHRLDAILTFNNSDFSSIAVIAVLDPSLVAKS
ncbi:MAG: PIN domain-containing protein [Planctomycetota bacterium]